MAGGSGAARVTTDEKFAGLIFLLRAEIVAFNPDLKAEIKVEIKEGEVTAEVNEAISSLSAFAKSDISKITVADVRTIQLYKFNKGEFNLFLEKLAEVAPDLLKSELSLCRDKKGRNILSDLLRLICVYVDRHQELGFDTDKCLASLKRAGVAKDIIDFVKPDATSLPVFDLLSGKGTGGGAEAAAGGAGAGR